MKDGDTPLCVSGDGESSSARVGGTHKAENIPSLAACIGLTSLASL